MPTFYRIQSNVVHLTPLIPSLTIQSQKATQKIYKKPFSPNLSRFLSGIRDGRLFDQKCKKLGIMRHHVIKSSDFIIIGTILNRGEIMAGRMRKIPSKDGLKIIYPLKFDPLNYLSVRRSSYHLKAQECTNLRAFNFCLIIEQTYVYWDIENSCFYWYNINDISWRCLKNLDCSSGLFNSGNFVIFKFGNSKFDLTSVYNFVNN